MLRDRLGVSERRACRYVGQHRSTQRHEPTAVAGDDQACALSCARSLSASRAGATGARTPGWASRAGRSTASACSDCGVRKAWRVPARARKRRRVGEGAGENTRLRAQRPNEVWALDYMADQTADGRMLRPAGPRRTGRFFGYPNVKAKPATPGAKRSVRWCRSA